MATQIVRGSLRRRCLARVFLVGRFQFKPVQMGLFSGCGEDPVDAPEEEQADGADG